MPTPNKSALETSYTKTMDDMQQKLKPLDRSWSQIVHSPVGRSLGGLLGGLLFRPRSLLIGSGLAAITLLGTYIASRLYDIPYSNIEPLIAFVFGWCIGLLYDLFFVTTKRHKR